MKTMTIKTKSEVCVDNIDREPNGDFDQNNSGEMDSKFNGINIISILPRNN